MIHTVETKYCYICGKEGDLIYNDLEDKSFGVPGKWGHRQCLDSNCNLIWLDPMPMTDEDVAKLYEKYYTHAPIPSSKLFARLYLNIRDVILNSRMGYKTVSYKKLNIFWKIIGNILSLFPDIYDRMAGDVMWLKPENHGNLLDIGCGSGQFMAFMRSLNWKVQGLDPDAKAVQGARNFYRLDARQGTLLDIKFPDETFDAVTMGHVIEHTSDPYLTLKEIKRILKVGGKLIITTTNSKGWGHKHYRKDWEGLDIPRHLYIYSCQSLKLLVENAGLAITEARTSGRLGMYFLGLSHFRKKSRKQNNILPHSKLFELMQKNFLKYSFWEIFVGNRKKMSQEEVLIIARKVK